MENELKDEISTFCGCYTMRMEAGMNLYLYLSEML
jgi:hypothetical protein